MLGADPLMTLGAPRKKFDAVGRTEKYPIEKKRMTVLGTGSGVEFS